MSDFQEKLAQKIDTKTKPLGALGQLEEVAEKVATVQGKLSPELLNPHIVVFAGDHGLAKEGVSAYPAEVTPQMVLNFVRGGAGINVFCRQNGLTLKVVDAGVNFAFDDIDQLEHRKVGFGTRNSVEQKAMTSFEFRECFEHGIEIVRDLKAQGCNVLGFGEMGIGNTSASALLMHRLLDLPLEECVGRGTGLDDEGFKAKLEILEKVAQRHATIEDPLEVMQAFGGFEMAMMMGAMVEAYEQGMLLLVDGFISTAVFLCAVKFRPEVQRNALFSHLSDESGHKKMLDALGEKPLLSLNLRLGEGTGCALAYPIVQSAVAFLNEMASFQEAGVSEKVEV